MIFFKKYSLSATAFFFYLVIINAFLSSTAQGANPLSDDDINKFYTLIQDESYKENASALKNFYAANTNYDFEILSSDFEKLDQAIFMLHSIDKDCIEKDKDSLGCQGRPYLLAHTLRKEVDTSPYTCLAMIVALFYKNYQTSLSQKDFFLLKIHKEYREILSLEKVSQLKKEFRLAKLQQNMGVSKNQEKSEKDLRFKKLAELKEQTKTLEDFIDTYVKTQNIETCLLDKATDLQLSWMEIFNQKIKKSFWKDFDKYLDYSLKSAAKIEQPRHFMFKIVAFKKDIYDFLKKNKNNGENEDVNDWGTWVLRCSTPDFQKQWIDLARKNFTKTSQEYWKNFFEHYLKQLDLLLPIGLTRSGDLNFDSSAAVNCDTIMEFFKKNKTYIENNPIGDKESIKKILKKAVELYGPEGTSENQKINHETLEKKIIEALANTRMNNCPHREKQDSSLLSHENGAAKNISSNSFIVPFIKNKNSKKEEIIILTSILFILLGPFYLYHQYIHVPKKNQSEKSRRLKKKTRSRDSATHSTQRKKADRRTDAPRRRTISTA